MMQRATRATLAASAPLAVLRSITMIIASRLLTLRVDGKDRPVAIEIQAPEQHSDVEWRCHFMIDWPDGKAERWGAGIDAVQALLIAMQMIAAELYTSEGHVQGRLFWDKPQGGYGFPVSSNIRDLLIGDDRKYL
jgi:hypothetical protein